MNHAGEIAALTRLVRPHVALVTAIASAHIENLGSEEAIADAKGEIFEGLEPDGDRDRPQRQPAPRPAGRAPRGAMPDADRHLRPRRRRRHALARRPRGQGGSLVTAALLESELTFTIVAARRALGVERAGGAGGGRGARRATSRVAGLALADMGGLKGRGERHRVRGRRRRAPADRRKLQRQSGLDGGDAEERSATERDVERRIAVLGPMRELGEHSRRASTPRFAEPVRDAQVDLLILVGEEMRPLAKAAWRRRSQIGACADDGDGASSCSRG